MSIEIRREGEVEFSKPLARALFRDSRLSFSARGLFAFLWDLPSDWLIRSTWLATRGPDGKDAIRARLSELRDVGAMRIEPIREDGGKVAGTRWVLISPEKWAKASPLSHFTESRISRLSVYPTVGEPATKVHQASKVHQEAAAPRACARGPAAGAAAPATVKRRTARTSGIVTWTADDLPAAERIEQRYDAVAIATAVAATIAGGKDPVPGLVEGEIQRQQRERDAQVRRAAADEAHRARLNAPAPRADAETRARGIALLPPSLRARIRQQETT